MHAGNGGQNVNGNDKGVGVSEGVGTMWNLTGLVLCLKVTLVPNDLCVSEGEKKQS